VHQAGNDRITALASNYGHLRVRQDEECPKILNDVDPEASHFGGGLGYLTDGHEALKIRSNVSEMKSLEKTSEPLAGDRHSRIYTHA
jgi:hypothetical protein